MASGLIAGKNAVVAIHSPNSAQRNSAKTADFGQIMAHKQVSSVNILTFALRRVAGNKMLNMYQLIKFTSTFIYGYIYIYI